MKVLIAVISPFDAWVIPREWLPRIRESFPEHTILEAWDTAGIRRLLTEVEVAFTPFVDRDLFPSLPRLRWIQSPAVGVGSLLYPELVASDVVVTSARGIRARSIAEHVMAVTLALARQLPAALRFQAGHLWGQDALEGRTTPIAMLDGKRMGIVGLGSIGAHVARLAHAFGMHVTGIRRSADAPLPEGVERVVGPEDLLAVLASSDVVVLSAPTTRATHHLIGPREVAAMKPGALLINVGRGQLLVDEALVEGLRSGHLGGAALDVFTHEPLDPSSPYWDLPNVIVTPHVSGAMQDYWTQLVALFTENLRRFQRGEPLLNVVDKHAGY